MFNVKKEKRRKERKIKKIEEKNKQKNINMQSVNDIRQLDIGPSFWATKKREESQWRFFTFRIAFKWCIQWWFFSLEIWLLNHKHVECRLWQTSGAGVRVCVYVYMRALCSEIYVELCVTTMKAAENKPFQILNDRILSIIQSMILVLYQPVDNSICQCIHCVALQTLPCNTLIYLFVVMYET